ncbi:MAG: SRPBCC family protein [Actinomycetes bacterium]
MIEGVGEAVVPVTPDEAIGLVLDLDRYRRADFKIGKVKWVRPDARGATVRFRSKMAGMPGPYVTQRVDRVGNRLDVHTVAPKWMKRMVSFEGVVDCTPTPDGTRFFHREALTFHGPFRLLEPMLRGWLAKDTPAEVRRVAAMLR